MDLKALKTFQAVVKHGSFIRAAEEMNYAQSTVTMQIQKLESDAGVALIERGKQIRLTEAGRLLYEQSLQLVKQMEQVRSSLADMQLGEAGQIRLGVTEPTASYRLPAVLRQFLSRYPKIRVAVEFANTPVLAERLLKGELDLALCSVPDLGAELIFEPLFKEPFTVLMPEDHPLACSETVAPEELRQYRLLITSSVCPYRRKLEQVLQEKGCVPLETMEIGSMTALAPYAASGLGIALVPKVMLQPLPPGMTSREISGSLVDMTFGLLSRAADYPPRLAAAKLYQWLKDRLADSASS